MLPVGPLHLGCYGPLQDLSCLCSQASSPPLPALRVALFSDDCILVRDLALGEDRCVEPGQQLRPPMKVISIVFQ